MSLDVVQLRAWCDQICREPSTQVPVVVAALGLAAAETDVARLSQDLSGLVELSPPLGADGCSVRASRGRFWELHVNLGPDGGGVHGSRITRHGLEDAMGPGVLLRRTRSHRAPRLAYRVVLADTPFTCDVLATFAEQPSPTSLVTAVTLRRGLGIGVTADVKGGGR